MDITTIEHPSITTENRVALQTHMKKFDSFEDAAVDGMALKAMTGKPFKLPESIDKLPDDASRATLLSQINKLYGREYAADLDGLADLDMKMGSTAEDGMFDEELEKAFKQHAVDTKMDKKAAQRNIEFYNKAMGRARAAFTAKTEEAARTAATERIAAVAACNEALIPKFGTKEKLDEQTVLLHRALTNNTGCTVDEAADVADFLKDREGATNATIRRLLISNLAPLATESTVHGPGGPGPEPTIPVKSEQDKQVAKDLGWTS